MKFLFENYKVIKISDYYIKLIKLFYYLILIKITLRLKLNSISYNYIYAMCLIGGPIFIKISQNISNKIEINNELSNKLKKFQDNNFDFINDYHDTNLLKNKLNIEEISDKPIFSGSIAAIYRCKYQNKECVLKICHKNITYDTILSINLFDRIIKVMPYKYKKLCTQTVKLNAIYNEIINQIDLNLEYNNLEKIRENFKDFDNIVRIPKCYYHNSNILIEEYIDGLKFSDFILLYPNKTEETISLINITFFKMFFDNYIHVDFHESNLRFLLSENNKVVIVIYDFGMISYINDKNIRKQFMNVFKKNIFLPDTNKLIELFISLNKNLDSDTNKFRKTINAYIKANADRIAIDKIKNEKITYENNKDTTYNIIQKMLNTASEFDIIICDKIFNILNSFLLIEDFSLKAYKYNKDFQKNYQVRYEYAETNGFINNIKKTLSK